MPGGTDGPVGPPLVRDLGRVDYTRCLESMRAFTDARSDATRDEIWLVEHAPVFTLGQAGKREHLIAPTDIPLIQSDRGGQVTYHGPGQIVAYLMIDIRRLGMGVRAYVTAIETAIIELLAENGIAAVSRPEAPGVYVDGRKIAALGLRVRKGASYHGLALNVRMDLTPFTLINPCGYAGLEVTQLADLGVREDLSRVKSRLVNQLCRQFGYDAAQATQMQEHGER
ncbi:MAG: lipoyl(octanoyl) transferase LipB [Pseudomonadales bacterium]|nr:lipoyl(octanoyl) transferase LipB [Pseudomonadales bacterium]